MASRRDDRPYFFLSYARTPKRDPSDRDDPDRWVYKLYKDLCGAILQMTGARPEEAGFMDRENKLGTEWSPGLITELTRCRVFVPLYSRRYFESDNCGREWFVFTRRGIVHKARSRQVVDAIVPALWTRPDRDKLPRVAQSVQFDHKLLGERYCTEGFYGIMKLPYRADYQRAVHRFAERIVAIGDESAAFADENVVYGLTQADFESLPSAFGPTSVSRAADGQLQIAVRAHNTATLTESRARDDYGATPHTWSLDRSDSPQPASGNALGLAKKCLSGPPLAGAFGDDMASGVGDGHSVPPGPCLVDAWVTVSAAHQEQLRRLDQVEGSWGSVLGPWNSRDLATHEAKEDFCAKLHQHLGHKLASVPRRCQMAANGIPTLQDFGQLLPEMSMIMMKRFRQEAAAYPPAGPVIERPRLRRADPEVSGDAR